MNLLNIGIVSNYSYSISKPEGREYRGIDVSSWQGYIDYKKVKEDGIEIVYIKASEGENFKDPYFKHVFLLCIRIASLWKSINSWSSLPQG